MDESLLEQGSEEWIAYRRNLGNASEVSALFDCSPFEPKTALQLWEVKKGFREIFVNKNMTRGNDLEPVAREVIEEKTGLCFEPTVMRKDRISASLDGITMQGDVICEIKCPAKGKDSETWLHVEQNQSAPSHYYLQIQQQLYVSNADYCIFGVYDEEMNDVLLIEVKPDPAIIEEIIGAWEEFFEYLDSDTSPPPGSKDVIDLSGNEIWEDARLDYLIAKADADKAAKNLETAKARIITIANGRSTKGNGVTASHFYRKGSVDYKKVPELKGVPLDDYRKKPSPQWRITVEKEK